MDAIQILQCVNKKRELIVCWFSFFISIIDITIVLQKEEVIWWKLHQIQFGFRCSHSILS